MNSAIIENADYADSRICVFLTVGVSYESDLKKAKELLAARGSAKQPSLSSMCAPNSRNMTARPR